MASLTPIISLGMFSVHAQGGASDNVGLGWFSSSEATIALKRFYKPHHAAHTYRVGGIVLVYT